MKALTWLFSFSLLAPSGRVVNFDSCKIGQAPPGWTVASTGKGSATGWIIRKDQTAPTPPYVLAEVSADPTQARAPLAILNDPTTRDADVSVRIKPISGHEGLA